MFIDIDELKTHLYGEQIEAISGDDDTIITAAIDAATAEAKGYLHKYDADGIFSATGEDRNSLVVLFVKDIALWHYINLANPGTDYKVRQDRYNRAIAWLKSVQAGDVMPDLPLPEGDIPGDGYTWGSNQKRFNHI